MGSVRGQVSVTELQAYLLLDLHRLVHEAQQVRLVHTIILTGRE